MQERLQQPRGESAWPADLAWAHEVTRGELAAPPTEVDEEVVQALLAELLVRERTEHLAWLAGLPHRGVAKAARTALHRLRSQKVAVEVPVPAEAALPSAPAPSEGEALAGMVSMYDGHGQRLVWLAEPGRKGLLLHWARASARTGLLEFTTGRVNRRTLRQDLQALQKQVSAVPVTADEARWFIHDAARRCEALGRGLPSTFLRASSLLGPAPRTPHPALTLPATQVSEEKLLALFELRELRAWVPESEPLRRLMLKLQELATSRLVISDEVRAEQVRALVDQAVADYFTVERCAAARTVLLDTAHLLAAQGRSEEALAARGAAELFVHPGPEVGASAFARKHVERVLPPDLHVGSSPRAEQPAAGEG
ncbi:MAG: hypothetical protein IT371_17435 [Deltaproteobacteria bacterium]|nr:hypothetical protein [Deltaproteobacteria bacterium]